MMHSMALVCELGDIMYQTYSSADCQAGTEGAMVAAGGNNCSVVPYTEGSETINATMLPRQCYTSNHIPSGDIVKLPRNFPMRQR